MSRPDVRWLATLSLTLFVVGAVAGPVTGQDIEEILSFDVEIDVRPGGGMRVSESITVRALGDRIRRGIFRDFPTSFPRESGLGRIEAPFDVVAVTRGGSDEPFTLTAIGGPRGRGGVRVRIGDPDVALEPGLHTYRIAYDTDRWIAFGQDTDRLYWNVTGNGWEFPIRSTTARVRLTETAAAPSLEAWTGPEGSTERAAELAWDPTTRAAFFATTEPLGVGEGLTIRLTLPAGELTPPSEAQRDAWFAQDWGGWVEAGYIVLLVLALYLLMWRVVGADPAPGPATPRREPPSGFSPASLGYLERRGYHMSHLAATLVAMAVKGAVRLEKSGDGWRVVDADPDVKLTTEEHGVHRALLADRGSVSLRQSEHERLRAAAKALDRALGQRLESTYFENNRRWFLAGLVVSTVGLLALAWRWRFSIEPTSLFLCVWLTGWTAGVVALGTQVLRTFRMARSRDSVVGWGSFVFIAVFATPFFAAEIGVTAFLFTLAPAHLVLAAIAVGATNVVFYHLLERPTLRGRGVLDQLHGFRAYLSGSVEGHDHARDDAEVFERWLPYAIALGLEERWAEWFGTRTGSSPTRAVPWFDPGHSGNRSVSELASLGSALSSTLSAASAPPSSGGGSSGGGGGGSSGGGGGGGGGGGW